MKDFWVTRYALSEGITKKNLQVSDEGRYAFERELGIYYKPGKDCFESRDDAVIAARKLQKKKIASLKAQIKKLQSIKFE